MKKTALQQAIDKLEARKYNAHNPTKFERAYNEAIENAISDLESLFPTEKEQHKQTFIGGKTRLFYFEGYFKDTYENPEAEKGNKE